MEEQRNAGDQLGRARDLGQGSSDRSEQFVYGLPSAYSRRVKSQWGALETIRGKYAETRPGEVDDLGRSVTPGFRNISDSVC